MKAVFFCQVRGQVERSGMRRGVRLRLAGLVDEDQRATWIGAIWRECRFGRSSSGRTKNSAVSVGPSCRLANRMWTKRWPTELGCVCHGGDGSERPQRASHERSALARHRRQVIGVCSPKKWRTASRRSRGGGASSHWAADDRHSGLCGEIGFPMRVAWSTSSAMAVARFTRSCATTLSARRSCMRGSSLRMQPTG